MKLRVLGIGDAFTCRHHHTSFLLQSDITLLIDGPQGLFQILRQNLIQRESIDGILLTHIHGDHTSGVVTYLLWNRHFLNRRTPIYTSRRVYEDFKEKVFPSFRESFQPGFLEIRVKRLEEYAILKELRSGQRNQITDSIGIEYRYNWHPVPTLGLRIHGPHGSIAISGDTCFNPELLGRLKDDGVLDQKGYEQLAGDWLWKADVIYHEATNVYGSAHTYVGDLEELADKIKKKIRLVHIPDEFKAADLTVAEEGETVTLTANGVEVNGNEL